MAKQKGKVKKYRKPLNLNIGMIIFAVVFFYVIYGVLTYFQTKHIVRYEVKEGSLAINTIYNGIILRNEEVFTTQTAGYINYFAYEGERVAVGDLVYTVDETGKFNDYLQSGEFGAEALTERELREFKNEIVSFVHSFHKEQYAVAYDFKRSLESAVLKIANNKMLKNIGQANAGEEGGNITYGRALKTGIVTYWTDGYEQLTADDITLDMFQKDNYEKKQILGNELMTVGDAAYKISKDEQWSIVIPVDKDVAETLLEEGFVKVRFLKNHYESWGEVKEIYGQSTTDKITLIQLLFTNSMVTFAGDRFLDIELILHDETGLKIPLTSIVEKEFFIINKDFIITDDEEGKSGVIRECYLEDGKISSEFIITDIYSYDEEEEQYYLDASQLSAGDVLYKTDSQETYTVSKRATLIGVYNMNKGYADFKQINILYQNDEYAIVKANTKYGLNVYDYIVLDASSVTDDQFINE